MKKAIGTILAVLVLTTALAGCGGNNANPSPSPANTPTGKPALSGVVKTGGSTSVEKVMNALIYQFQDDNGNVTINYEMNGSGDGIKNTISGMYEIGHSSRELKTDGTEDGLTATAYAIDGIAIVVNQANTVENLTKDQINGIYTGKITNWNEVGGGDALITVITREPGSGTRSAIAELIGLEVAGNDSTNIVAEATVANDTGSVQTAVTQNPNAIGYMSFSDVDTSKVKTVKYEDVAISTAALKDGTYLLKRDFYLLNKTGATLSPAAQAFKDFVMSAAGQRIVAANNLLPIK